MNNGITSVTRSVLGARGADCLIKGSAVSYPLYDAHGNMVAALSRGNEAAFTANSLRHFDPWVVVRSANATGDPKGRYCASLGHKQDDESGLVYMRARYDEPASGRFVSEDPDRQGNSWYAYAGNQPADHADQTGRVTFGDIFTGTVEEAVEKVNELRAGIAGYQGAMATLTAALTAWATKFADVFDVLWDEECSLLSRGDGMQITGLSSGWGVGLDFGEEEGSIVVKTYFNGDHVGDNVIFKLFEG